MAGSWSAASPSYSSSAAPPASCTCHLLATTTGSGSASSPYATIARALLEPNRIAGELALSGTLRGEGNVNVTFTSMSTSIYSTADGATIDCESSSPGWTLLSGAYWVSGIAFRACDQAVRSHSAYAVLRSCVFEQNTRNRGLNGSALQVDSASAEAYECEFVENENPDGFGTIYIERGNLKLMNASIHDNAACAGATIAVHAGSVQLYGVDARDNTRSTTATAPRCSTRATAARCCSIPHRRERRRG